jgi:antitoxin (DNA-binding transcriptional repressor) of toxin-antitoxin stability system
MELVSIRELRGSTAEVRKRLEEQGELLLTANGQPIAILSRTDAQHAFEDALAIRRARARAALTRLQEASQRQGTAGLSPTAIDKLVKEARQAPPATTP